MNKYILIAMVLLQVSCTSFDSEKAYRDAMELRKGREYEKSFSLLLKAADHGHTESMAMIGVAYVSACEEQDEIPKDWDCWVVKPDYKKGESYLLKAANNGSNYAIEWLVSIYGSDSPRHKEISNPQKALSWGLRNQNNAKGLYDLAGLYERGIGTKINYGEAEKYYLKSVENSQGEDGKYYADSSVLSLAYLYAKGGHGLKESCEKSKRFLLSHLNYQRCEENYEHLYQEAIKHVKTISMCQEPFPKFYENCIHEK